MAALETLGTIGWQVGALGIAIVTVTYLAIVRWWTDHLGRVLAGLLTAVSLVLALTVLRIMKVDLPGNDLAWRAIVFWLFASAVWSALVTMLWAQFFAPRRRSTGDRLTTPHGRGYEESNLAAAGRDRDGDSHDRSGGDDRQ
jgi:hypothetical protein